MPYATQADLIARFGTAEIQQISDLDRTGAISVGRVAKALDDASRQIDGYVGTRYALPIPAVQVPVLLQDWCCDIARYLLMTRPTEEARTRRNEAIKMLQEVARGQFQLGLSATELRAPDISGPRVAPTGRRSFSADTLSDYAAIPTERR